MSVSYLNEELNKLFKKRRKFLEDKKKYDERIIGNDLTIFII